MPPLNFKIAYLYSPVIDDPLDLRHLLAYKIDCPDGKCYGREMRLEGPDISIVELSKLVDSINEIWEKHSVFVDREAHVA